MILVKLTLWMIFGSILMYFLSSSSHFAVSFTAIAIVLLFLLFGKE